MTGSMSLLAFAIALAAAPSSAPAAFDVRGSTTCPGPELVAEHLRPLLPADAKLPAGAHIEVVDVPATSGAEAEIEIRLVDGASAVALASRRLHKPSSCAEAAEGLAVVAATWAARYHAVSPGAPPLLEPQVPAPPPVLVRAARPAAPSVIVSMGASAGIVTASRGGSAPFAAMTVEGRGAGRPWAVRLSFAAVGERTLALSPGVVAWNRLTASPEVAWTWGTPSAFAQVGLGALAGVSFVSGRGFSQDEHAANLDLGAAPSVRVGARLAAFPVTLWLGAGSLFWLREQRVRVDGLPATTALPRMEAVLAGGLSWTPEADGARGP